MKSSQLGFYYVSPEWIFQQRNVMLKANGIHSPSLRHLYPLMALGFPHFLTPPKAFSVIIRSGAHICTAISIK